MAGRVFAFALCAAALLFANAGAAPHAIEKAPFGRAGDQTVDAYILTNAHGIEARVITYGATLVSLKTPDRGGHLKNIILRFNTLEPYLAGVPYFGATVGRYANRIAGGKFTLNGKTYQLAQND